MSSITKQKGIHYRVLKNASTKEWVESSFVTQASDVYCDDGLNVESKLGLFKGISTTKQSSTGYALDSTVAGVAPTIITATLNAGNTTISRTHSAINSNSVIDVATTVYGVSPTEMTQSGNTVTLTFDPQENDLGVKIIIS